MRYKKVHFTGVGGVGMAALAAHCLKKGCKVSGSDMNRNGLITDLESRGLRFFNYHSAETVHELDPDLLVYSTAIAADNPERINCSCPTLRRGQFLASVLAGYKTIAVCGSHGKTSTSGLVAKVLQDAGWDPTVFVGAAGGYKLGSSEWAVVEADESDGSMNFLSPFCSIITNIDEEHSDYYGSFSGLKEAFDEFADNVNPGGYLVTNSGVKTNTRVMPFCSEFQVKDFGWGSRVSFAGGSFKLAVPGAHQVSNAFAVLACLQELGISSEQCFQSFSEFTGMKRRAEVLYQKNGVCVIDDYAHHPTEISCTLEGISSRWTSQFAGKRVFAVFEPHRFSRLRASIEQFKSCFPDSVSKVLVTDTFSAGEAYDDAFSGESLVRQIDHPSVEAFSKISAADLSEGDLVITLGAGKVRAVAEELCRELLPCP